MTDQPPIVVSDTPAPTQLVVGVRQAILLIGSAVSALGFSHYGTLIGDLSAYAGIIAAVITVIYGQLHTIHDHAKMKTMANAAPKAVAVVKASA
jgi:hypothetical protein